jgi:hypothetical protein
MLLKEIIEWGDIESFYNQNKEGSLQFFFECRDGWVLFHENLIFVYVCNIQYLPAVEYIS